MPDGTETCIRILRATGIVRVVPDAPALPHEFAGLSAVGRDDERVEVAAGLADGELGDSAWDAGDTCIRGIAVLSAVMVDP